MPTLSVSGLAVNRGDCNDGRCLRSSLDVRSQRAAVRNRLACFAEPFEMKLHHLVLETEEDLPTKRTRATGSRSTDPFPEVPKTR